MKDSRRLPMLSRMPDDYKEKSAINVKITYKRTACATMRERSASSVCGRKQRGGLTRDLQYASIASERSKPRGRDC